MERIVGHIDMDAFFASVEERERPFLKQTPVIVGADPQGGAGRGVVATANYAARALGIRSALPVKEAWRKCEEHRERAGVPCTFITPDAEKYRRASHEVFAIVAGFVPVIEMVSIDEAYLDLTFCNTYARAHDLAVALKDVIARRAHLTASVGIGPNKMIAKIASDYQKPDGLTVIEPPEVEDFLRAISVGTLPGVGSVSVRALTNRGIRTVGDLQRYSWEELERMFGKRGFSLWERARGIDERPVCSVPAVRKSIGKHHTFATDEHSMHVVMRTMQKQAASLIRTMRSRRYSGFRTVVLTVRTSDFATHTRSITTKEYMRTKRDIELKALKLLLPFFEKKQNPQQLGVRLVGVRIEKLT